MVSLFKIRTLEKKGAKFSIRRVGKYEGGQDLVSSGFVFFPLTASQLSTDKIEIFFMPVYYDPENDHADALQGRRPQLR